MKATTATIALETLQSGGRIGGHNRILYSATGEVVKNAKGNRVTVPVATIDNFVLQGLVVVTDQQYVIA